jgi:hypothetical protein
VRSPDSRYFRSLSSVANTVRRLRGLECVDLGDALSPNYVHYFTRAELEAELEAGGFRLISFETKPYGHAVGQAV